MRHNSETERLIRLLNFVDAEYLSCKESYDRLQSARVEATKAQEARNELHPGKEAA